MFITLYGKQENNVDLIDAKNGLIRNKHNRKSDELSAQFLADIKPCTQRQTLSRYKDALRFARTPNQVKANFKQDL